MDAVHSAPHGPLHNPFHPRGHSIGTFFETTPGDLSDLEQIISVQREVVDLIPDGHPHKPRRLDNLAYSLETRFKYSGVLSDVEQAILLYSQAACASTGPISDRFHSSMKWISCARHIRHHTLLHAYSTVIALLSQLGWVGRPLTHYHKELVLGADVVREAAAAALDSGYPGLAVEWLEQGHAVVWGELLRFRNSYEELSSTHQDHARRLQRLSAALDRPSVSEEGLWEPTESAGHPRRPSLEQEADRHRALAIERDQLIQEIRQLPGFERFLLHKEFSQLRASAQSGPVVFLNAAESRCDALIVLANKENAVHIPLPTFTLKQCGHLRNTLANLIGPYDDRTRQPIIRHDSGWESILSTLWKGVVKPVLDGLGVSGCRSAQSPWDLSRVFWCPSGPFTFLPIHAAGLYGTQYSEPGHKVFDFVISSYIPSLNSLTPSIQNVSSVGDFRCLAVPQQLRDGHSPARPAGELEHNGHPEKPSCLHNLGHSFLTRFERLGQLNDQEDAISRQKEAVDVTPDGHLHKPDCLDNFSNSFLTRFKYLSQLTDLEDAISRQKEAVGVSPDGHPHKPGHLQNLDNSFRSRFECSGQLNDLEDAISSWKEAIDLTPHGHPDEPGRLQNLGNSFRTPFERLGQLNDLEDAISRQKEATDLTPDGHSHAVIKNSRERIAPQKSFIGSVVEVLPVVNDADGIASTRHHAQDSEHPSNRILCLADEQCLERSNMVSSRPRGSLAFLSACKAAMGDKNLTDSTAHMAARMLFAGYGGVIATMWSVGGDVASCVVKDVYEELFRTETMPNCRRAARALHDAVGRLRENNASFVEWVAFIHVAL